MKMKTLFSSLLILLMAANLRAQDPNIRAAFPTKDGFIGVGSGGENVVQVWASRDGRKFNAVQQCKGILLDAVVVGERLVVATSFDGLYVIALDGSWKVEHTPVKGDLIALASNGQQVIALATTQQWQMRPDGKWVQKPFWSSNDGPPSKLAFGKGIWVVAAEGPAEDMNTGGLTQISWSADGEKWQPARIEMEDAIGIFALVGNTQGFLALTATGDGLFSADGKVWKPVQLPGAPLSSDLFAVAGKFWLLERAERPPHRLRSSADGKTWKTYNLPMEMRAQFLVEKDSQPWIFGTNEDNFGVIARADKPDEPAAPVPTAVAQAPQTAPAVPATKPVTPVGNTPPALASPSSDSIAAVALALEKFDKAIHAAEPNGYAEPAVELLKTLRANANAHPSLPALTDAMRDVIGVLVEAVCGLPGYFDLVMGVDNQDVLPLMNRLSPEKRESIRKHAGRFAEACARAQANRTPGPERSQIVPQHQWQTVPPDKGVAQRSEDLDIKRVYQRVATGDRGAVVDLAIAHGSGTSVPADGDLALVWAKTYTNLGGTQTFFENLQSGEIKLDTFPQLAEDGSAIMQFLLAELKLEKAQSEEIVKSALALYEKSAAGGFRPASLRMKQMKEGRADKPSTVVTAADWFKAAEASSEAAALSKAAELRKPVHAAPATPPASAPAALASRTEWVMPTNLVMPEKALASFEQVFTNAADFTNIGPASALLLKNLEGKIEATVFDAIFGAVVAYVAENAGIQGYLGFSQRLPQTLATRAEKLLPKDKRFKLSAAQLALMRGSLTEEIKQDWPAGSRSRKPSQGSGVMQLDRTRARLLCGDAGGALDLALEYFNGWGVPTDIDLFVLYMDIAARLNPRLASLPEEPEAKIDALISGNSAHGRYMRATSLLSKGQEIIPPGQARTLLEQAAALGHSLALMQLTNSDMAETKPTPP